MNEHVRKMADQVREWLGLHQHQLIHHYFFREVDDFHQTVYTLTTEWVPDHAELPDDGSNPAGTAVVDINFHTGAVQRIVFVHNTNSADSEVYPTPDPKEYVIEWIEDLTGLTFGRQFLIAREHDHSITFHAAVDNIPVSPGGTIEVSFNDNGELTLFSIDGHFPSEEHIQWEPFALTPDKYEPVALEQCHLVELPDQAQEKWLPVFGIEETFITNDAERTIPFQMGADKQSFVAKDEVMRWSTPMTGTWKPGDMDLSPDVSVETARANKPHPDTIPLTEAEVAACEREVLRFMRLVYPKESGKRKWTGVYLQDGYIIAEIQRIGDQVANELDVKIKVVIERETCTAINYFDQEALYGAFQHFDQADDAVVSRDDAVAYLRPYLQMDPMYVYDSEEDHYIMCGKLDCAYGVDAVTGDVIRLNTL
ncbi:hypothetical protein GCM10008983_13300 [Lentibacillus halophilus]|uniref:Uncharacterized protein n=1 Tax=Lentibacillus halophilus TaxID=295065 RepID=A0ABN0Z7P8_9BACI